MTPEQLNQVEFLQELHKGWDDDNIPIGVLHARWLLQHIHELEKEILQLKEVKQS